LCNPGTLVSSTNKTDRHDITEILLKVALNTINQTNQTYVPANENSACKNMKMFDKKLG
jgi:S-ribosylhomocysteine lyase LuxS involved in autoinducer biosynthesis